MTLADQKQTLLDKIDRVRDQICAVIEGVDPDTIIHQESGWRLRDMLAHIVAWQEEAIAAGLAHIGGDAGIPFKNISSFNADAYEAWKDIDYSEIYDSWLAGYAALKEIVERAPDELWDVEFINSWRLVASLAGHVHSILAHDIEHRDEIRDALDAQGGT
jgi:hypothetical protein